MIPRRRKRARMGTREAPQQRSPAHLKWIRGHECAVHGKQGHICEGRIEAAHVRRGTDGGLGVKPSDKYTLPLCSIAHGEQHQIGESAFEKKYGIRMLDIAVKLWLKSPHRQRGAA